MPAEETHAPATDPAEVMLRALCVDHGHARQAGGAHCRTCRRRVDAVLDALASAGWQLAPPGSVVVELPTPESVDLVCGCGVPPDGALAGFGCSRECMDPALAFFPGGVTVDLQAGAIYDGTGRTFEAQAAELQAGRLLAAARYFRQVRDAG